MSEPTVPTLREQIRAAIQSRFRAVKADPNGEWDHWIDDTTDDVVNIIAAQPQPEMGEIESAIERYHECAFELAKADVYSNNILQRRWEDRGEEARDALLALISRAIARPDTKLLELREIVCAVGNGATDDESEYDQGAHKMWNVIIRELDAMIGKANPDAPTA